MDDILDQIRATFDSGIWYPVVSSVLMMPDACGAIEFWGTTKRSSQRYIEWYDGWVLPHFKSPSVRFDGSVIYIVRNAMLHESTGFTRGTHGFDRVVFAPPNRFGMSPNFCLSSNNAGIDETAFIISLQLMMEAMDRGVRNWLEDVRLSPDRRREEAIAKLVQYRPNGQPPHFIGLPVVS